MTMNKITLAGFAAENAPAYICEKAQRAWAHSAIIIARSEAGETQTALADEYDVSQGTIYRILKTFGKTKKQRKAKATNTSFITQWDQSKRGALQRDLKNTRTALDQAEKDLAAAKANEQAAVDRLTDGDSWANRWQNEYLQAKADLEAAEAQIDHMAERLAECRNRGFWARVFNR
jgi:chromosome segregation ATPase